MANGATFSMMPFAETEQGTLSLLLNERVRGKNNALSPADNVAILQHNFILFLHAAHFSTQLHALPCLFIGSIYYSHKQLCKSGYASN